MTEEEKRYLESEPGLIFDSETGWYIHGIVVDRLNAYESRVKELEQAIEKAIDNINCDASEAAMRPLIELMEGK